jgi:hypothetical protein
MVLQAAAGNGTLALQNFSLTTGSSEAMPFRIFAVPGKLLAAKSIVSIMKVRIGVRAARSEMGSSLCIEARLSKIIFLAASRDDSGPLASGAGHLRGPPQLPLPVQSSIHFK